MNFPGSSKGGSENGGTPKSSILIGFSIINHPFWSTPIFGNPQKSPPGFQFFFMSHWFPNEAAFGNVGIRAPYSQSYVKDCKSMDGWTGECC